MWKIPGRACRVAAIGAALLVLSNFGASAQTSIVNQNISGFNLPGVSLSQGSDEVRAADGTTCRSAVGGSGAYLDVGVIGNPEQDAAAASMSAYGRVVVPLGKQPRRLDCTRLYDLEVQRLEMELRLTQMGLGRAVSPVSGDEASDSSYETSGAEPQADQPEQKLAGAAPDSEAAAPARDPAAMAETPPAKMNAKLASAKTGNAKWEEEGWTNKGIKQ